MKPARTLRLRPRWLIILFAQIVLFLLSPALVLGQVIGLPNLLTVGGTSSYATFGAAYTGGCVGSGYASCEIWDCNLGTAGETMTASPWNFNGTELPVHLRFCPGVITVNGPLIVPRNSVIEGAGRATSGSNVGTVIQANSAVSFGGVGYITWTGGTTCTGGGGSLTIGGGSGSGALAAWTISGGNFNVVMRNPGGGYGTNPAGAPTVTVSGSPGCSGAVMNLKAVLTGSVVIIGDTNQGIASSTFGSRLMNVTVDCNNVPNCTAIELQNAQEQSGPFFVSAANYTSRCLWVHGMIGGVGTDNSSAFDIECNGYYTAGTGMSPSTVPVEFDNTKSRGIIQATINPVNSQSAVTLTSATTTISCTSSSGSYSAVVTAANSAAGTIPANWTNGPPYDLNAYVAIGGIMPPGWNQTWPISSSITTGMGGNFTIVGSGACPFANGTPQTGMTPTATLEPSADIIVCSGTTCAAGAEGTTSNNPTQVSLIQTHLEHAGVGVFATGGNTSVNLLAPTMTTGNTMYSAVTIDSGANAPAAVNISSLLANGGVQYLVVDGITGNSIASSGGGKTLATYISGTALIPQANFGTSGLQPPVAVKLNNYTVSATDNLTTFDNTGAMGTVTYTLPDPPNIGMTYTFLQSLSGLMYKVFISPGAGITIQPGSCSSSTPTAGDTLSSVVKYSAVTLQAINLTTWRGTSCSGAWTIP